MRNKIYTRIYKCQKCNKTLYYHTNEEYSTVCKTCGNELIFEGEHPYNPKNGIKMANTMNKRGVRTSPAKIIQPTTPIITCPYCKSNDCKKISGLSKASSVALRGIFALGKTTKQWHCNNCKSDF